MMTRRTFTTSAIAFGAVALTATPAFAHAALKSSVPAADSTVKAPTQISIYFTEANSACAIVSKEAAVIDPRDAKHLTLALPKGLPAGVYTVQWTSSAADDGHKLSRTYNFTIA
jgi:methionine-rich copper-binding protein CopC